MRQVAIGIQDFERIRTNNYFYIDKTYFVKEWWENGDSVTLITRPRRFGKTLTMDMLEKFFSVKYTNRADLFQNLKIWQDENYRNLQGTYPVIFLSFADIKGDNCSDVKRDVGQLIQQVYRQHRYLLDGDVLYKDEKEEFQRRCEGISEAEIKLSLQMLSGYLYRYYGKKVIILLDEYDTPMQEAYVDGYWDELTTFIRNLFTATFKTNLYLERAIMTGITRVSKESIFSGLNNLEVVTTTSEKYEESFGFTEDEVFDSLDQYGLSEYQKDVKDWYDGFTFGKREDIYNPWSIINFLDKKKLAAYWSNTSSNSLVNKLIREGSKDIKQDFEILMTGESLMKKIDEQIIYNQLYEDENAVWSLLLASGYLKVQKVEFKVETSEWYYYLTLTNREVYIMFRNMVRGWFSARAGEYNDFIKALLKGDVKAMNAYMNRVALATFSFFDSGNHPSEETQPERFYHGFVLGLMMELAERYALISNRESGFGRYDVCLEPKDKEDDAIIMEFKVLDTEEEKNLTDTVQAALEQIEDMKYEASLITKGIPETKIRKYGFAFQGKKVLIGK